MALSSNTIIHFTNKISSLKGILSSDFSIRYCQEEIHSRTDKIELLIPMVSFCDIPFSQIIQHLNSYGCYGIGLSKKWAESKGLNPVLYLEKSSNLSNNIIENLLQTLKSGSPKLIIEFTLEIKKSRDFIRYLKNYQGDLKRVRKTTTKDYRFSDEREWRYVLDPSSDYLFYANVKKIPKDKIPLLKEKFNKEIQSEILSFTPNDINYIIIKNESERDGIITTIEKAKRRFSHKEIKRLTSRIISTEQLRTDLKKKKTTNKT